MLSFWEKQSFLEYDFVVIGGGIVGMSAALSLREKRPDAGILILEKGLLPTGASTKNAGFACVGSLTEILDDLSHSTQDEVLKLVEFRYKGLQRLRKRLAHIDFGYRENGSHELLSEDETSALDELEGVNQLLKDILPKTAFRLADEKIKSFGFNAATVKHLIENNNEGELHTGKMMRALQRLCNERNIEIKTGCSVCGFEETSAGVQVITKQEVNQETITFSAQKLIVCTNAFTKTLFPDLDIQPGRGQVLVTTVIPNLPFKGVFHFDRGYYYFRELEGRVLFGGGRNLDFKKENTTDFSLNPAIISDLQQKLTDIILPEHSYAVEHQWTGIMAFGSSKQPIIKKSGERIVLGVRMGGMGVAIGSEVGERLAEMSV